MFVIYHGYGAVCTTAAGADLSEFQYQELQLTNPQSIRIGNFKSMSVIFFGLNPELYTVSLQDPWSNYSTNIFCHLKETERTSYWVGWLKGCEERGTSPITLMVVKWTKASRGRGGGGVAESSQSSQAIDFGSWQSIQPADHPAVSMSYAEDSGYEKMSRAVNH
jgi:hypothetical protein